MSDLRMPFGKYGPKGAFSDGGRGVLLDDVPANYLAWLRDQDWIGQWPVVKKYIEDNKAGIEKQLLDGAGEI